MMTKFPYWMWFGAAIGLGVPISINVNRAAVALEGIHSEVREISTRQAQVIADEFEARRLQREKDRK